MAYYFFNKCDKKCLRDLEKILGEIGLTEQKETETTRFWSGDVLDQEEKFYQELLVCYTPSSATPLVVQTNILTEIPQEVKKLIKTLIATCNPTEIYKEPCRQLKYDLQEFQD